MLVDGVTEIAVWDTETTGVDTENDLIVTSFFGIMNTAGELIERREWVIDHGVEIPEGAASVHGWTTERVREHGRKDAEMAILEIVSAVESCAYTSTPLVIYNAPFDLTILDRGQRRMFEFGSKGLQVPPVVIDPLVIDKTLDKWRKGSRRLADVAARYRIPAETAHEAEGDCIMAGRLALLLLGHSAFKGLTLEEIHAKTAEHARANAQSFKKYLVRKGEADKAATVREDWPIVPWGAGL